MVCMIVCTRFLVAFADIVSSYVILKKKRINMCDHLYTCAGLKLGKFSKPIIRQIHALIGKVEGLGLFGFPSGSKPVDQGSLTISSLHLTMIPFTKMSFFTDKKEVKRSWTALGYIAHAVSLIASYLQVPLRYPLRLGGSRSYIRDYAPAIDHSMSSSDSYSVSLTSLKSVEFPLFIEGQDFTRAAYAMFLLNKDLEQLLNFIGVKSSGPRYVLANLKELLRTILSSEYIEM
ncbi:uncharacterized protein LOC111374258 [Olea europaea var. sylvestris]|uniref:uncharacterized protein LOC111374258 n=1 Tax=Olea europaea var. sylvestris TaxID=158386 RepID=UPI000C1D1F90|nr:uncharacterized protein LOC111374258 [Olea europaea var. sylvestris]